MRIALLIAIALAGYLIVPPSVIKTMTTSAHQAFEACRAAGPWAFFTAMALLPGIGFPLAPFTLTAGPLFAPTLGRGLVIVYATLAVMVNVSLSYWIASRLLRPFISRLIGWLGYRLPHVGDRSAWVVTVLLRVVPGPPFFLQSYALAAVGVPFGIYMIVSTLVPFGYIASMILFGDAIARRDPWGAAGAGLLLFTVGGVIHQIRRRLAKTPNA